MSKVVIRNARLSYANLFVKDAFEGQEGKYSTALLVDKNDVATVNAINKAIEDAKELGKSTKFGGKLPANLKTPLRDGDVEHPEDPVYANKWFFNATTNRKPQVLDTDKTVVADPEEGNFSDVVYSGCFAHVSVNFYAFNVSGNRGIAAGLGNVMKAADGEMLAGGSSAADDFADIVAVDSIDDLL